MVFWWLSSVFVTRVNQNAFWRRGGLTRGLKTLLLPLQKLRIGQRSIFRQPGMHSLQDSPSNCPLKFSENIAPTNTRGKSDETHEKGERRGRGGGGGGPVCFQLSSLMRTYAALRSSLADLKRIRSRDRFPLRYENFLLLLLLFLPVFVRGKLPAPSS